MSNRLAADTRRHAVNVYGSPDGRQWVSRDDYEALLAGFPMAYPLIDTFVFSIENSGTTG